MAKQGKRSVTMRTLHYYWRVTARQWPVFLLALISTLGFVSLLSYGNPFVVARIVDRVSAEPVAADQVFKVFAPYIAALIAINLVGQVCSKLQDYSVWKLEIGASYELATLRSTPSPTSR